MKDKMKGGKEKEKEFGDREDRGISFAVDCVNVSRPMIQVFTCALVARILNWCKRTLNV